MSIKRSSSSDKGSRSRSDESHAKIDRQELWDELEKRAEANEPFSPAELGHSMGAPEAAVAKALLNLAHERLIDKAEGGRYLAGPIKDHSQAAFIKAFTAKPNPKRGLESAEVDRLKKNNDEMRRRLLEAVAERDRLLALLKKHGIDPAGDP